MRDAFRSSKEQEPNTAGIEHERREMFGNGSRKVSAREVNRGRGTSN
jgi:hypothetical protein